MVTQRYLSALDMDKAVDHVTTSCHHCASLHTVPTTVVKQSTNPAPDTVGISFAADVIKRAKQFILVLRECVTSYTVSTLLPNKCHDMPCDALISLCINMQPLDSPLAVIRTETAPCFMALDNDPVLHDHRILFLRSAESRIETGTLLRKERSKNLNLNSFDRIPMVGQFLLLYSLSQLQPWTHEFALGDCQLTKCGHSMISSQISRFHCRWLWSDLSELRASIKPTIPAVRSPKPRGPSGQ